MSDLWFCCCAWRDAGARSETGARSVNDSTMSKYTVWIIDWIRYNSVCPWCSLFCWLVCGSSIACVDLLLAQLHQRLLLDSHSLLQTLEQHSNTTTMDTFIFLFGDVFRSLINAMGFFKHIDEHKRERPFANNVYWQNLKWYLYAQTNARSKQMRTI